MIVPAQFGDIGIPDKAVRVIEGAAVFPAPCEDFAIRAALQNTGAEGFVVEVQKSGAYSVRAFAQIRLEFLPKLPGRLEADFSYHAWKIFQAIGFFQGTAWQGGGVGGGHGGECRRLEIRNKHPDFRKDPGKALLFDIETGYPHFRCGPQGDFHGAFCNGKEWCWNTGRAG